MKKKREDPIPAEMKTICKKHKKTVYIKIAHEVAVKTFESEDDVEGVKKFIAEFIAEWIPLFPYASITIEQFPCGEEPISDRKEKET